MQSPSSWTAGEFPWSPLKKKKPNWAGRTLKRTKTSLMWLLGEGDHWRSVGPGSQSCCLSCARSCPRVLLPGTQEGKTKMATGKTGSTEIWTRIAGFKVQSANHYTMGPPHALWGKQLETWLQCVTCTLFWWFLSCMNEGLIISAPQCEKRRAHFASSMSTNSGTYVQWNVTQP